MSSTTSRAGTPSKRRWMVTIGASLVIHAVFCTQAVSAVRAGKGGLVADEVFLIAFLPHYMAMYFLPPSWPVMIGAGIDWWRVAGKLTVSYPASLLYGWVVGAVWHLVDRACHRARGGDAE
jgi:hypothetical protein